MRPRTLAAAITLAFCISLSATAAPKQEHDGPRWKPAEVLVKYKKGSAPAAGQAGVMRASKLFAQAPRQGRIRALAEASGLDRMYRLELRDDDVEAAVARLRQDPAVEIAEPNWIIHFPAVPDDPQYQWQWGLHTIGAAAAWDVQTSGSGVVIGIVDTGIDLTHPELAPNLWTNPGEIAENGIDDDGNGFVDDIHGWDFIDNDADPSDDMWAHGTRVAGIIAAVGNNATGVCGVLWSAKIASLRIGNETGSVDAAIQAIAYANAMGFRVTNNSWGWHEGGQSFLLDDVVEAAEAAGNLFVVSAGNESKDNDQIPTYPAHYATSNVISVTATNSSDTRAYYGNYGLTSVDLGAPGEFIDTTANGGGYSSANGTSFATPFVSGAAALLWTTNPALTHQQVRDEILSSSEPLPSLHGKTVSGGRLSLSNMFDPETVAPAAITDVTVLDATFRSVVLRLTATGDDGTAGSATRYDVRASQTPITAANFDQAAPLGGEPIPAGAGALETFKATGLEPSTTYYLAVRAIDNAGNASPLSNVVTFTTTRAAVLLDDNVEGGPRSWTVDGSDGVGGPSLWHIENIYGGSNAWRYGNAAGYDTGARNWGTLTSRELDLTQARDTRLRFTQDVWTQRNFQRDLAKVEVSVDNGPWTTLMAKQFTLYQAMAETIDLSAYDGQRIRIRFSIDTVDAADNDNPGWWIDDIIVDATSSNAPPVASLNGPYSPMEDAPEALSSAGSSDPEGASLEYKWSFGDGTFAYTTGTTVSHTWTLPGVYTITLVAFDGVNASDPVSAVVSPSAVNDRPVANISLSFAPPPPYLEETPYHVVGFGSTDEESSPLQCRWDYGDGTTWNSACVGMTVPHSWNTPGTYTITLIVNDGELDSLPATQSITIVEASNDAPIARPGGPYNTQPNQSVTLDGTASSDEETTIASYLWTFADGTTSTASQPVKTFPTAGVQNVTLVVTDQTGLQSATATTQVRVCGATTANLFSNPVYTCPGGTAKVGVNVSNALLPITLTWSDGYTQQVTSLVNGYYAERVVSPTATTVYALSSVTDSLGCAGTVGPTTTTVDFASAVVPTITKRICPGQSALIEPTIKGSGPFTITWNDGFTETVTQAPDSSRVVTPGATSTYSITSMTCASCPQGTTAVVSGVYTVEVMEPLSATLTGGGTSCNGGSVPVTVTITGGAPPFTIRWSNGSQSSTSQRTFTRFFNPATTTTYTATVDSYSCSAPATGSATVTPWTGTRPSVTGLSNDRPQLCEGQTSTVTATLAGDGLPFTVTWNDGVVQTAESLSISRVVSPSATTVYSITSIVNAAGCSGTTSGNTTVFKRATPTATVSGGGAFCAGGSVSVSAALTGTPPFNITWSDGFTQTATGMTASRNVGPSTETVYTITSLQDSSCTGTTTGSATATPRALPTATVSGSATICPGQSQTITAELTGTAPFSITWSDGLTQTISGGTSASRTVTPSANTTYTITSLSDAYCNGTSSGSAAVALRAIPTATVSGGGSFCEGTSTTINAALTGTAPFNLTWSDGFTQTVSSGSTATRQVNPASAMTYTVTSVSDAYCTGTASGSATATPIAATSAVVSGGGSFCDGSQVTISAALSGAAPFNITWSDGFTQTISSGTTATRQVSPASQTTYTITSITGAGCAGTASGQATATPRPLPTATVSGGGSFCEGTSTTINAALTGTAPFNLTWSDGFTQTVSSGSTATRQVNPASAMTYTVTSVSDAYCTGTASGSATATPIAATSAVVSGGGSFCDGSQVTISAALSGAAPFNITWSDGFTQTISSGTTATRQVSPASQTTYTITSITGAGCAGTASGQATATPRPSPTATVSGGGSFCAGTNTTINAALTGTAPFNITWSDGFTQTIPSGSTATRQVNPASATTYTITSLSDAYCTGSASGSATATPRPLPAAVVSGGGSFCAGTNTTINATLTGTAPFSITWSDGLTQTVPSGSTATRLVNPAATTTYTITSLSDAYCSGTSSGSATATPMATPTAVVSGGGTYCPGSPVTITATLTGAAPFSITWSDGFTQTIASGTTATRQVSPASTTTYSITSFTGAGCPGNASGSATVTPRPQPAATVSGSGTYCEGTNHTITAALTGTAPFSLTWSDGFTQTVASGSTATRQVAPLAVTTYTVTAVSDAYCSGTSSGSATVTPTLKPVITAQPQNTTIQRNRTATLTVTVSGTGNNYQWYRGASGNTSTPVGLNQPSYTTPKLTATTQYWVKVWKTGCTAPASATNSVTATVTVQ